MELDDLPAEMRDRLQKLERITASGRAAYASNYARTHLAAEARALLGEGERTQTEVSVAGRLKTKYSPVRQKADKASSFAFQASEGQSSGTSY